MTTTTVTTVRDIMHRDVRFIEPTATVSDAAEVLAAEVIGLLLVVERGHLVGVMSERDVVRSLGQGEDPDDTHVLDVMTEDVETIDADGTVEQAGRLMLDNEIRHVVVTENGEPVAVISSRDVLSVTLGARVA